MKITIDKKSFTNDFLKPINKVTERGVIKINKNNATALVNESSSPLFLYCDTKINCKVEDGVVLSIGDFQKLLKAINCIEEEEPTFEIKSNHLHYSSPNLKFKYHLLEDGVITAPTFNLQKLEALKFDTTFSISKDVIKNIIRNSTFTSDSTKIYFYTQDEKVFCELNDRTISNLDMINMLVSDSFTGNPLKTAFPLRLDWFDNFTSLEFEEISVKYNSTNNVVIFHIETKNTTLKYIVSTLTK